MGFASDRLPMPRTHAPRTRSRPSRCPQPNLCKRARSPPGLAPSVRSSVREAREALAYLGTSLWANGRSAGDRASERGNTVSSLQDTYTPDRNRVGRAKEISLRTYHSPNVLLSSSRTVLRWYRSISQSGFRGFRRSNCVTRAAGSGPRGRRRRRGSHMCSCYGTLAGRRRRRTRTRPMLR